MMALQRHSLRNLVTEKYSGKWLTNIYGGFLVFLPASKGFVRLYPLQSKISWA